MVDPPAVSGSEQDLLLRPSKRKWICLAILGVVATAVGVWMIRDGSFLGWVAVVFFGPTTVVTVGNLIPGSGFMRLTSEGVFIRTLWWPFIYRWQHVENFRVKRFPWDYSSPHKLFPRVAFDIADWTAVSLAARWRSFVAGGHGVIPDTYGLHAQDLADLLNQWKAANAKPS